MTLTQFEILPIEMSQISDRTWFLATEGRKKRIKRTPTAALLHHYYYFLHFFFFKGGTNNVSLKARGLQFGIRTQLKPSLTTTSSALGAHGSLTLAWAQGFVLFFFFIIATVPGVRKPRPLHQYGAKETNGTREEQWEDGGRRWGPRILAPPATWEASSINTLLCFPSSLERIAAHSRPPSKPSPPSKKYCTISVILWKQRGRASAWTL